jgi:hypothetical protein
VSKSDRIEEIVLEKNVFAIKKILMIEEIWIKVFRWRSFPPKLQT